MRWHEFIFSDRRKIRLLRHFAFWGLWWLYFSAVYYTFQQPKSGITPGNYNYANFNTLIFFKSFLLLFIHATASYAFIYILLPRYLVKAKWLKLLAGILLLLIFLFAAGYFMYLQVFPFINSFFNNPGANADSSLLWSSVSVGLLNAPKVIAAAAAIKLIKYWWLKQKEKEQLERKKINADLELLKAQIRPGFLFNALNNIYAYSLAGSPRASEMLLKLSDLLSYILYECDKPLVPLEKEIDMMKEYMSLEKTRMADSLEMEILVKGDTRNKFIAPFLLLPFIENSFKHCAAMPEKCWISLEMKVEENFYIVKLINGIPPELTHQPYFYENARLPDGQGLENVKKRLILLYPNRHELKMTAEEEVFLVNLKIQMDTPSLLTEEENATNYSETGEERDFNYARQ